MQRKNRRRQTNQEERLVVGFSFSKNCQPDNAYHWEILIYTNPNQNTKGEFLNGPSRRDVKLTWTNYDDNFNCINWFALRN